MNTGQLLLKQNGVFHRESLQIPRTPLILVIALGASRRHQVHGDKVGTNHDGWSAAAAECICRVVAGLILEHTYSDGPTLAILRNTNGFEKGIITYQGGKNTAHRHPPA